MAEITLRDNEVYEYDIIMPLRDFVWSSQEEFLWAYIDGYEIESDTHDFDNIERRHFKIRRLHTDDHEFDVVYIGTYAADTLVYIKLFGVDSWQSRIDRTYELIAKYGVYALYEMTNGQKLSGNFNSRVDAFIHALRYLFERRV